VRPYRTVTPHVRHGYRLFRARRRRANDEGRPRAIFALLIALIIIVSKMPDDNPLKRILSELSYRVGATVAAGALAIPVEPILGLDAVYDIGVPIALIWYWQT
jgi:hypothetical protein